MITNLQEWYDSQATACFKLIRNLCDDDAPRLLADGLATSATSVVLLKAYEFTQARDSEENEDIYEDIDDE
jgi:hypothetical protein